MSPNDPLPLYRDQRATDCQHLKLLAIFHFVVAGLAFAGIGFLALHFMIMSVFFNNPDLWKNTPNPPPPQVFAFFGVFKYFYLFAGFCLILGSIGNLLSGFYLRAKRNRFFSLVVAALNCLQFPFGTVLGVFTIMVLIRESVCELYETA